MSSITGNGTSHIYYNITLTNNDTTDTGNFPNVTFTETRNTPFLNCPEDYNMSVIRFALDTPTLPIMVCQPIVGSTDPLNLIYGVKVGYRVPGGAVAVEYNHSENLRFTPPTDLEVPPPVPITQQDIQNPFYNMYSYNAFILMLNTAVLNAYTAVVEQYNKAYPATPITDTVGPYFSWDTGGNLAILTMPQDLVISGGPLATTQNDGLYISFNASLYNLFSSFNAYRERDLVTGGIFYELEMDTGPSAVLSSKVVTVGGVTTTVYDYQVIQEYTTCPLWSPISSIVFTTSMLPINPELQAAPIVFNDNQVFSSVGTNANLTTVLTDFIVPLTTGTEYKPSLNYTPAGEYRLVSLFGRSPASSIQVNVFYKNRFGTLVPLTLGFGCSASIKIMFRRKDYGNIIVE